MKRVILLTLLLSLSTLGIAQTMSIVEFKPDENDLTPNTAGTIVLDQNGSKCALIKIETTEFGLSFDVGSLGVVKTEQHTGEVWLYIPEGVKRISISHPELEKIRDYDLGMSVKRARTYIMKLQVSKPASANENLGTLEVKTNPLGAEVFIDDISVGKAPLSFSQLIPGKHKVTIKHEGYYDYESYVNITTTQTAMIEESLAKSCDIQRLNDAIIITTKGVTFKMIKVEGGSFMMGATPERRDAQADELPVHSVTLSDYYIGETEVTNELWTAIMGSNPSVTFSESNQPVNNVSWYDCERFINRLSSLTGLRFALPTEAQWEYAARGGNKSRHCFYSGSNEYKDVGWVKKNAKRLVQAVKQLQPNELGIYDMSGNVWEWCSDWFGLYDSNEETDPIGPDTGTKKVLRGACVADDYALAKISSRNKTNLNTKHEGTGLRLTVLD